MITRKKRRLIIISIITLIIFIILGILCFLYLNTDMLKSNETLFIKYFTQNFSIDENMKSQTSAQISELLEQSKYTSNIEANIEYIQNISTSNENKNSKINDINIKIESQIDNQNNYEYRNISLQDNEEKLSGIEYYNQNETQGIRINGVKQFVSLENSDLDELLEVTGTENLNILFENIDIFSEIEFSKEEKEQLLNSYLGIIQSNISNDRYKKQSNSIITINNEQINTNAYYVTITKEEYNNIIIKILEQVSKDEIILSKIDSIEIEIKEKTKIDSEESYRDIFTEYVLNKIDEIQSSNIGQDEVKIIVYENEGNLVRTSIEKENQEMTLDIYNENSTIKLEKIDLDSETENTNILIIEKSEDDSQSIITIKYKQIDNEQYNYEGEITYSEKINNNIIEKYINVILSNEKYKATLNINNEINLVNQFEETIDFEENNIIFNDLEEQQKESITNTLKQILSAELDTINEKITLDDYKKMLQNLNVIEKDSVEITDSQILTETQKNRFNIQFQFFESQDLNKNNMLELIEVVKNNFDDMSIVLKTGEIQYLDKEKLYNNDDETQEYLENISEIIISIKQNTSNEEKEEEIKTFLDVNENKKYTVSLEYSEDGLVNKVRIKIQN